jgi:hypothetical protein
MGEWARILEQRALVKNTLGNSPIIVYVQLWTPRAWAKYTLGHSPIIVYVEPSTPALCSKV